jgi:hypothetical protein
METAKANRALASGDERPVPETASDGGMRARWGSRGCSFTLRVLAFATGRFVR